MGMVLTVKKKERKIPENWGTSPGALTGQRAMAGKMIAHKPTRKRAVSWLEKGGRRPTGLKRHVKGGSWPIRGWGKKGPADSNRKIEMENFLDR